MAVAIVGILGAIAMQAYSRYLERADITQVLVDIGSIERAIQIFQIENAGLLPPDLSWVGGAANDPWGNPYQYLPIAASVNVADSGNGNNGNGKGKGNGGGNGGNNGVGKLRKDKNLVPINSDYDLYSMGKDGASVGPLTAQPSRDDIIRANNGDYIGLAADY